MKVLELGAGCMAGSDVLRILSENDSWQVVGSVRRDEAEKFFSNEIAERMDVGVDVENFDQLVVIFERIQLDWVWSLIALV